MVEELKLGREWKEFKNKFVGVSQKIVILNLVVLKVGGGGGTKNNYRKVLIRGSLCI